MCIFERNKINAINDPANEKKFHPKIQLARHQQVKDFRQFLSNDSEFSVRILENTMKMLHNCADFI